MSLIAQMRAITGRWLKEDDTTVNVADAFDNSDPSNPKLRALLSGSKTASDNYANPTDGTDVLAFPHLWDPSNTQWVRERGNYEGELLASAPRSILTSSPLQTNPNAIGVIVLLNVTVNPGGADVLTMSLVEVINGVTANAVASIMTQAAENNIYTLSIYPGSNATPDNPNYNKILGLPLPRTWKVTVSPSGGSWTYDVQHAIVI